MEETVRPRVREKRLSTDGAPRLPLLSGLSHRGVIPAPVGSLERQQYRLLALLAAECRRAVLAFFADAQLQLIFFDDIDGLQGFPLMRAVGRDEIDRGRILRRVECVSRQVLLAVLAREGDFAVGECGRVVLELRVDLAAIRYRDNDPGTGKRVDVLGVASPG